MPRSGANPQSRYDLVDCESLERAEAIAARIPDARLVAVEVRRLMDLADMEM